MSTPINRRTLLQWLSIGPIGTLLTTIPLTDRPALAAATPSLAPKPSPQITTISVLVGAYEIPTWKPIIAAFETQHPTIRINMVEGPSSPNLIEDLYTSAFILGDSPYDLVYMDIPWVSKFAAAGWLQDLSPWTSADMRSDFLRGDWDGGIYNNKLYRLPGARTDAGMLYYRKDLLDQAGYKPPETIDQLVTIGQELQRQGKAKWGYLWQGKQYEGTAAMFVELLAGFGGTWLDPQTLAVGLDQPESIAAVRFLVETIDSGLSPGGVVTYQEEETRRLFQNGEAVFLRNWPYVWTLSNGDDSAIRGKFGLAPMVHQPGQTSGACQGGWGWGIAASSPHPEAAWQVINFFSSIDSQYQISLTTGNLPTRRSLYQNQTLLTKYPHFSAMLEVLDRATIRPPVAQYAQVSDILQRYLSAALTKRLSPEAAMAAAAEETRSVLGRIGNSQSSG
jgi:multiple sugar transport system substrate-binding protein